MSKQPDPWPSLSKRLEKVEAQLARLASASAFYGTGMHPNGAGGLDSDNFDPTHGFSLQGDTGDAEFNGNVDVGGTMDVGGTLHVTGNTIIGGTLSLPAGIIDNDALANPVTGDYAFASATGFGLSSAAYLPLATATRPVPSGFSQAIIIMTGGLFAYNPNTSGGADGTGTDSIECAVNATPGYGSETYPVGVSGSGGFASAHAHVAYLYTGLVAGTSITFELLGTSTFADIAPNVDNRCDVSGSIIWLR